jgi:NAD(P)-dependent dehydrogenase (short-subunit alcohol dehydrogenase family)
VRAFEGRVAVVTGAASGIGLALAQRFAAEGMKVVMADVEAEALDRAAAAVRATTPAVLATRVDVARAEDVERLARETYAAFGAAHVVCNNAGVAVIGAVHEHSLADWQWVLGVNLWGVIHGVEAFVPRMVAQKQPGHVVNTASMAGLIASQGLGVYNTTKYAVVGLSETLQKDLRGYDIGVSVLCPMGVNTAIRQSERNRPAALRNQATEREGRAVELIGRYLSPDHVAERVLRAIYANRLYVITHEEGLTPLKRRFERMAQAIEESK